MKSLRARGLLMTLVLMAATDPAAAADLKRAEEIVQGKCFICHGAESESSSPVFPRLAGQHAQYTERQPKAFNQRERTNDNAVMHTVAVKLTELELKALGCQLLAGGWPPSWHRSAFTRTHRNWCTSSACSALPSFGARALTRRGRPPQAHAVATDRKSAMRRIAALFALGRPCD